jgi:alanine-synthesizing transaminase
MPSTPLATRTRLSEVRYEIRGELGSHLKRVVPAGALYAFPGVDGNAAKAFEDHAFLLELLESEDVLVVPGSSFNVPYRNHFGVTLLPEPDVLRDVFVNIDRVLQRHVRARRDAPIDLAAHRAAVG